MVGCRAAMMRACERDQCGRLTLLDARNAVRMYDVTFLTQRTDHYRTTNHRFYTRHDETMGLTPMLLQCSKLTLWQSSHVADQINGQACFAADKDAKRVLEMN